jgi:hypothetical protein
MGNKNSGCRPKSLVQKRRDTIQACWKKAADIIENKLEVTDRQFELIRTIISRSIPQEVVSENYNEVVLKQADPVDIQNRIEEIQRGRKCLGMN